MVATAEARRRGARRLLRGAGAHGRGERRGALRLVAAMVRLGQNFLADPNLLDAIVRDAELEPGDVVLEVGAGEGVLTERLAAAAAPRPRDRARPRPRAGAGGGRRASRTSSCTGRDAMKIDLAALDPAPTAMVANLPYSVATPLILRTIEELPSLRALDGDGPARDRRPAAGGAGQPHLRLAERARPARLRGASWCARSTRRSSGRGRGSTRRSSACAAPGPAPTRATRELVRAAFAHRRKSLARSLEHVRPGSLAAGARGARRARPARGRARRGALPRGVRGAGGEAGAIAVSPRPRQAQPLPLPRAAPRRRPARALLAVRAAGARRPDRGRARPSATRSSARRSEAARTSPSGRWPALREQRLGAGRRCGSRSRSGSRSPPASAAAAPTPPPCCGLAARRGRPSSRSSRRSSAPTSPPSWSRPSRSCAAPASASSACPTRRRTRSSSSPGGGGLSTARRLRRGRRASGSAAAPAELDEIADRIRAAAGAGASPLAYADLLVNDLEPAARALRPEIGDALEALRGAGAGHAMLTGSGPTAVGLCEDLAAAERVAERARA